MSSKKHTKEFKLEALRLMEQSERPAIHIAMPFVIRCNQLHKWNEQIKNPLVSLRSKTNTDVSYAKCSE